jgi:Tfp pilus assembly protein PilO
MRIGLLSVLAGNRKARILSVLLVVAALLNIGFYYTKTMPTSTMMDAAEGELADTLKQAAAIESRTKSYDRLIKSRSEVDEFKMLLPTAGGYTLLLKDMYDLGMKRGMLGESFGATAKGVKSVGGMEVLSFTYPVSGSYKDVREFIHEVETSDLFLNINNLGLSAGGKGGEITLQINISTYVRR